MKNFNVVNDKLVPHDKTLDLNKCVLENIKTKAIFPYPLHFSNFKVIDKQTLEIDKEYVNVEDLRLKSMDEVSKSWANQTKVYLKSMDTPMPTINEKFGPLLNAALKIIEGYSPIPLTKKQHQHKMLLIRSIQKIESGASKTLSVSKIEELLSYYNLSMNDILKDKYVCEF